MEVHDTARNKKKKLKDKCLHIVNMVKPKIFEVNLLVFSDSTEEVKVEEVMFCLSKILI